MTSCRLCSRQNVDIRESHFLARAFYARIRKATGSDPVIVTPTQITQRSGQVKALLLCPCCEDRFSKRGEKWTLENYPQMDGRFPVQNALSRATPIKEKGGDKYYKGDSVQGITLSKLAYFAVSVFWRAGAYQWNLIDQTHRLSLGPYENALRLYLLDQGPFPERAALHILVSPVQNHRDGILFPSTYRERPFHCHGFSIPGITFTISLGNISNLEKEECAIHSDTILATKKADDLVAEAERKFISGRKLP
jgi:hypothetical protein